MLDDNFSTFPVFPSQFNEWPCDWSNTVNGTLRTTKGDAVRTAVLKSIGLVRFDLPEHRAILFAAFMMAHGRQDVQSVEQPSEIFTVKERTQKMDAAAITKVLLTLRGVGQVSMVRVVRQTR